MISKMRGEEEKSDSYREAQLEAQQELQSLYRQYRTVCNDKKAYTTETQNTIRKQKAAIENLLQERKHLITLSDVAGRVWNKFCDGSNLKTLTELLNNEQVVLAEIDQEKNLMSKLDKRQKALEKKITEWRRTMRDEGKDSQIKYIATQKHIRVIQNRLDNTSKKFNFAMAGNQTLRKHIDDRRCQKAHFQSLYQRLVNKLSTIRAEIQKVSDSATAHFNVRDEAQHRMASLRERGERDLATFNRDVKDFVRAIEHDRKLREFMTAKAKDRASILREEMMRRDLKRHGINLDGLNAEAQKYETIFEKIKEATDIYDTETLVSAFIQKEDENFALFNFVNTLNTEIEGLQEEIQLLRVEMEKIKKDGIISDGRRKDIFKELERQCKGVKARCNSLNSEAEQDRSILERAKRNIEKLFKKTNCDRTAISELLGGGTTIDDYNAIQYLGIIEQKCNELLQIKAMCRLRSGAELEPKEIEALESLQGAGPQPEIPALNISPPKIEDDSDVLLQTLDMKPLTMSEVQIILTQQGPISKVSNIPTAAKANKRKR